MSTNTYVALKTTTVTGSPASDITFTSIPTIYTDLMLVVTGSAASGNIGTSYIQLNGDTGTTYSTTYMAGNGSTATSSRFSSSHGIAIGGITAGIQTNQQTTTAHIMNYSNNTTNKTVLARYSNAGYETNTSVGLWQPATISTSAVTSIRIYIGYSNTTTSQDNWAVGTTATIYGVASADVGAYATGGIITQDANYYYHAFGSSSTFTPTRNLTADILVVAGGGGGGATQAGGGGAGGVLAFAAQSLTSGTGYSCTIGSGGAGTSGGGKGTNGGDSQFGSLTLVKGGGGGGSFNTTYNTGIVTGADGGSGGGGGSVQNSYSGGVLGGSPTSGQGYAGGSGNTDNATYRSGGGGGGAGGAGGNYSSTGGAGGLGTTTVTNFSNLSTALTATGLGVNGYLASGGAGGGNTRGVATNGGGSGGDGTYMPQNGVASTGSGGGGGGYSSSNTGGSGGSGLIIVRYAK